MSVSNPLEISHLVTGRGRLTWRKKKAKRCTRSMLKRSAQATPSTIVTIIVSVAILKNHRRTTRVQWYCQGKIVKLKLKDLAEPLNTTLEPPILRCCVVHDNSEEDAVRPEKGK